jgi:hypothetical protein
LLDIPLPEIDHVPARIYQHAVSERSQSATEEAGAIPTADAGAEVKEPPRGFLKAARKDLTPEEASSPAGVRWLQYEAERLDQECDRMRGELEDLREQHNTVSLQYSEARLEIERLRGAKNVAVRNEILATLSLAAGSAGLSVTPAYLSIPSTFQFALVTLVVSAVLFLGGIFLRIWR